MADIQVEQEKARQRKAKAEKNKRAKIKAKAKAKTLSQYRIKIITYMPVILIVVSFAIIYFLLKKFKIRLENIKIDEGEYLVRTELDKLDPNEYKVLNNIYLPTEGDVSQTEIDHVVVSNYGVFAIETKAHSGAIYGNAYDKKWVSYIRGDAFFFMNPCRQNYKHTQTLKKYIKKKCVFSIIVFTHATEVRVANTSEVVVGSQNLIDRIMSFQKKILIDREKEEIYNLLLAENIDSYQTRQRHRQQVNIKKNERPSDRY